LFAPPRCGCLIFWGRRRRRLAFQAFSIQHQHPRRDNNDLRWKREPLHQPNLPPEKILLAGGDGDLIAAPKWLSWTRD